MSRTMSLPGSLLRCVPFAGAMALILAASSGATTITTNSFNTWKTSSYVTGSPTELNFLPINASSYNTAAGIVLTPSGASTPAYDFTGIDGASYYLAGDIYSKTLAGSSDAGAYINVAFGTAENAFLLSFANNSGASYTVTFSDGETFNTTSKVLGFSVSHTISSLTISTTPGVQAVINDFWFGVGSLPQDQGSNPGNPASTPEPATMLLMAGGLLSLAGAKRRFKK